MEIKAIVQPLWVQLIPESSHSLRWKSIKALTLQVHKNNEIQSSSRIYLGFYSYKKIDPHMYLELIEFGQTSCLMWTT